MSNCLLKVSSDTLTNSNPLLVTSSQLSNNLGRVPVIIKYRKLLQLFCQQILFSNRNKLFKKFCSTKSFQRKLFKSVLQNSYYKKHLSELVAQRCYVKNENKQYKQLGVTRQRQSSRRVL